MMGYNSGYGGYSNNNNNNNAGAYSNTNANNNSNFASPSQAMGYGGGFVAGSQGSGSPGAAQRAFKDQSLVPVSIKALLRARPEGGVEGPVMLDGKELNLVKLMGRISQSTVTSQFLKYLVSDGVSSVECTKFIDSSGDADVSTLAEGTYVKVFGTAKFVSKTNTIQVNNFFAYPVASMDEVTFHNLECVYVHLQLTRGPTSLNPAMSADQANAFNSSAYAAGSSAYNPAHGAGGNMGGAQNAYAHMPRVEAAIMSLIDQQSSGLYVEMIQSTLRGLASAKDIDIAIQALESEGHIYDGGEGYKKS